MYTIDALAALLSKFSRLETRLGKKTMQKKGSPRWVRGRFANKIYCVVAGEVL